MLSGHPLLCSGCVFVVCVFRSFVGLLLAGFWQELWRFRGNAVLGLLYSGFWSSNGVVPCEMSTAWCISDGVLLVLVSDRLANW